jgi:hypothetical protein
MKKMKPEPLTEAKFNEVLQELSKLLQESPSRIAYFTPKRLIFFNVQEEGKR